MRRNTFKKRGFTLIELIAVVAILAIVGVLAYPSVRNRIESSRVEQYRQSCLTVVEYAQMHIKTVNSRIYSYTLNGIMYDILDPTLEDKNIAVNDSAKFAGLRDALVEARDSKTYDVRVFTLGRMMNFRIMFYKDPNYDQTKIASVTINTVVVSITGNSTKDDATSGLYAYRVLGAWYFTVGNDLMPIYTYSAAAYEGRVGAYALTTSGFGAQAN